MSTSSLVIAAFYTYIIISFNVTIMMPINSVSTYRVVQKISTYIIVNIS